MPKLARILTMGFILLSISIFALHGCSLPGGGEQEDDTAPTPLPVAESPDRVVAEGEVVPIQEVELKFELSGIVQEVIVEEGSVVEEQAALARLDTRDLELDVQNARANLNQALSDYERLLDVATGSEIAVKEAGIRKAQANLAQAYGQMQQVEGQVTQEDIAAAEALVEQRRAELAELESGPKITEVQESQARLDDAYITLQETRDRLSAAKSKAYEDMQMAANTLRDVQANYSGIYWDNREIERDWTSVNLDLPQDHKDREENALRGVRDAEAQLEQARVAYEEARQAEITGLESAEAKIRELHAQHTDLLDGSDVDAIAQARANIINAEANLEQLIGLKRSGDLNAAAASVSSAQAGVEEAQAGLEDLLSSPRESDIEMKEAVILQREVALKQAELNLDKATLKAPFAGTVVEINPTAGEWFGTSEVAVIMADLSAWKIETTDLDELGIVNVRIGSPVEISFDALPDLTLPGTVTKIQALGKEYQGDIVYKVTVAPDEWDERIRWKMTATISIEPESDGQPQNGPGQNQNGNPQNGPGQNQNGNPQNGPGQNQNGNPQNGPGQDGAPGGNPTEDPMQEEPMQDNPDQATPNATEDPEEESQS